MSMARYRERERQLEHSRVMHADDMPRCQQEIPDPAGTNGKENRGRNIRAAARHRAGKCDCAARASKANGE
jgi:hypothetical protein